MKPKKRRMNTVDEFAKLNREKTVKWDRVAASSTPVVIKDQLAALSFEHNAIREQLDALRQTRGQRSVGTVKVPVGLQTGMTISDAGVERRGNIPSVLPAED